MTMEYLILIHGDETQMPTPPTPGTPEFDEVMGPWMAYNQQLIDGGHWIAAARLAPTPATTTMTRSFDGATAITDGPFMETKEQLGGFYLVRAADLDEALELARALPVPVGSVEVRPVSFRPDADHSASA